MKIAVFVEGQTELIVARDFLLKYFEYCDIDIQCRTLFADFKMHKAPYDYPNPEASMHFQIINVGNDNAVLSRILKREELMWNAGYDLIVGLRDMYSEEYRRVSQIVSDVVIGKFKSVSRATIVDKAVRPDSIFLSFAIMEAESWILGLSKVFEKLDQRLTDEFIDEKLNINLRVIDPEHIFHPAQIVSKIYQLVDKKYRKKQGDIEAIVDKVEKQDIDELLISDKCKSFNEFFENLRAI